MRTPENKLRINLRDMGNRTLEHRPADKHIFSCRFRNDATCCIFLILDGAQHQGLRQLSGDVHPDILLDART